MSKRILRALMQLFALIAAPKANKADGKKVVERFLLEQLDRERVEEFLKLYEQFVSQYQRRKSKSNPNKLLSVSSVKILTICSLLNEELTQQQKIIVLLKLVEFVRKGDNITEQANEFLITVAESFKIPKEEFFALRDFIFKHKDEFADPERILVLNSQKKDPEKINHLYIDGLKGEIYFLYIKVQNLLVFYFEGEKEIYLNQQLLSPYSIYILSVGAALRTHTIKPIYYSDIISVFNEDKIKTKIVFEADKIFYKFKNGKVGIHEFNFIEKSGRLVGIMGASGSGKTTLLNILNGNFDPTSGHIYINGVDFHKNKKLFNGYIGYVSQDDLLIEELTVFENLYFNAKLCFGNADDFAIKRKVIKNLKELGLYEIKDMKVGSVLNRKISGGQRKRLNIALELIREPPILFLDEPTSGLSSRDSENILDLLKDLTLKGKLVFVVIHQPSSGIFKMFDRLVVLDQGGYVIYNGKPIEAIIYFKSAIREADWSDTVCPVCGNVNPEQIFNIIETRVLDEYGNQTLTRKFTPEDWYERFKKYEEEKVRKKSYLVRKLPEIPFNVPTKLKQFKVFVTRDFLTKVSNLQYIVINLFETPLMALILAYIIKYWQLSSEAGYTLFKNENLPVYIFMSVIIAVFVGLTVSAQEIYKDKKILRRESFLNLSRSAYLSSKMINLALISAYQSLVYVLIGNSIIEVTFFNFSYWIVLFSVWFSANILGLIISEAFKSSATIYIVIPFLVIPQIILSGVLVPFNKLNPKISNGYTIPWYGEIITARWAYEALAVRQFKDNEYEKNIYNNEVKISYADYIKGFWCSSMQQVVVNLRNNLKKQDSISAEDNLLTLRNEFSGRHKWTQTLDYNFDVNRLNISEIDKATIDSIYRYIAQIKDYYINYRNSYNDKNNDDKRRYDETHEIKLSDLKQKYHNEKLSEFMTSSVSGRGAFIVQNKIYRDWQPVYDIPENYFFRAHFYAPFKPFFGKLIDTFWFNIAVIWLSTIILIIFLYYKVLHKFIETFDILKKRFKHRKEAKLNYIEKIPKRKSKWRKFLDRYS